MYVMSIHNISAISYLATKYTGILIPCYSKWERKVVSIDLFSISCMPFLYHGVYFRPSKKNLSLKKNAQNGSICPKLFFCANRASKTIVPPKEMLLSFSIETFLTNYDVTNRKHWMDLIYSTV